MAEATSGESRLRASPLSYTLPRGINRGSSMTKQKQFIIIGKADSDTETELCLFTRRVFASLELAQSFKETACSDYREAQIVECYFPIPTSLYAKEWEAKG